MSRLFFCNPLIEFSRLGDFVGGEHVGGVYFSISRDPAPRNVKKLQFLPFFHRKNLDHRKSQFLAANYHNSRGIGVFDGGESIASIIFDAWMSPGPKNFEIFETYRFFK